MVLLSILTFIKKIVLILYVINPLDLSGNYKYHLLYQSVIVHFVVMDFVSFSV
jgi:hypothetical protein